MTDIYLVYIYAIDKRPSTYIDMFNVLNGKLTPLNQRGVKYGQRKCFPKTIAGRYVEF